MRPPIPSDHSVGLNYPHIVAALPYLIGEPPGEEVVAVPIAIGTHDPVRIPTADPATLNAALRVASEHAAALGPVLLIAHTPDTSAGQHALDQIRMTIGGLNVQARMVTDGHTWMDVDQNVGGAVTSQHHREVARLFPPPTRSVNPADLINRFTHSGSDLSPALIAREATWEAEVLATREALAAERDWIAATVQAATTAGAGPLPDTDAARMLLDVHNHELRDHALTGLHTHNSRAHTALWSDLASRAPEPYRDSPTAMTALSLWFDHRPAEAALAAEQVRDSNHILAGLVMRLAEHRVDPRQTPPSPEAPLDWPPTRRDRPTTTPAPPQRPATQVTEQQHSPAR